MANNCICCGGEVKAVGGGFKCIFCGTLYASEEELIPKKISKPTPKVKPAEIKKEPIKAAEQAADVDSKSAKTKAELKHQEPHAGSQTLWGKKKKSYSKAQLERKRKYGRLETQPLLR